MLGHANWALNAYPLLKPALASSYQKVRGKKNMGAAIWVNKKVIEDLNWFADYVERLNGVSVLAAEKWEAHDAELEIWCDASNVGLGFWVPEVNLGFIYTRGDDAATAQTKIFFHEALCVLSALEWVSQSRSGPMQLAIHTNSMNTYTIFNSLKAYDQYNIILKLAVEILLNSEIDLRVFHVPGERNAIADSLSHLELPLAQCLAPSISVHNFTPSQVALRASQE
jgi:hypothetical protein